MCNHLPQLDHIQAEAFAYKLLNMYNNGAVSLMISIGHRTGLFDSMSQLEPSTTEEIAEKAGLNERYVREWLNAMVVGEIVSYDPDTNKYFLPAEHASSLTREAGADNLAMFGQYISSLGYVEDGIVDCFKNGGGLPYTEFPRFHEVMAEDSGQSVLPVLIDTIIPMIPGLTEKLTEGIDVLDIGCGSGRALILLAQHFPNSRFVGLDFSEEAIGRCQREANLLGLTNISFIQKDASKFAEVKKFDFIATFDAIHDQGRPDMVLQNIYNALKDDGVYLMQDIAGSKHVHKNMDHPLAPLLYTISCMHCMTVSLAQEGGMGLGAMWGEETARDMLTETGFTKIETRKLPHDVQNNYYIIHK